MGIGTAGGGGLRKVGGGASSRSIVCHASRSAASSGQRALSRSNTFIALAALRPKVRRGAPAGRACGTQADSMRRGSRSIGIRLTWAGGIILRRQFRTVN